MDGELGISDILQPVAVRTLKLNLSTSIVRTVSASPTGILGSGGTEAYQYRE